MEKVKYIEDAIVAFGQLHGGIQLLFLLIVAAGVAYFFAKLILNYIESSKINKSLEDCASVIGECKTVIHANSEVLRDFANRK